jgi:hypothetical protein
LHKPKDVIGKIPKTQSKQSKAKQKKRKIKRKEQTKQKTEENQRMAFWENGRKGWS